MDHIMITLVEVVVVLWNVGFVYICEFIAIPD
jgi:hypothetical protein